MKPEEIEKYLSSKEIGIKDIPIAKIRAPQILFRPLNKSHQAKMRESLLKNGWQMNNLGTFNLIGSDYYVLDSWHRSSNFEDSTFRNQFIAKWQPHIKGIVYDKINEEGQLYLTDKLCAGQELPFENNDWWNIFELAVKTYKDWEEKNFIEFFSRHNQLSASSIRDYLHSIQKDSVVTGPEGKNRIVSSALSKGSERLRERMKASTSKIAKTKPKVWKAISRDTNEGGKSSQYRQITATISQDDYLKALTLSDEEFMLLYDEYLGESSTPIYAFVAPIGSETKYQYLGQIPKNIDEIIYVNAARPKYLLSTKSTKTVDTCTTIFLNQDVKVTWVDRSNAMFQILKNRGVKNIIRLSAEKFQENLTRSNDQTLFVYDLSGDRVARDIALNPYAVKRMFEYRPNSIIRSVFSNEPVIETEKHGLNLWNHDFEMGLNMYQFKYPTLENLWKKPTSGVPLRVVELKSKGFKIRESD